MAYMFETVVCPFCGNGHAHITYEENRVYQLNCPDCHNAIFHPSGSWDAAVGFFKRMGISDDARIRELLAASDEGRLVVLPCKVGDTVWLLKQKCKHAGEQNKPWDSCHQYWSNVRSKEMWGCAGKDSEGNTFPCEKKEMVWYAHEMEYSLVLYAPHIALGKNLFLTREEAEAALKGGKDNGKV